MRKRKKPTGLILALAAFALVAIGLNALSLGMLNPLMQSLQRDRVAEKAREEKGTAKDVADKTKAALAASPAEEEEEDKSERATKKMARDKMMAAQGGKPLIAVTPAAKYEPKPNDSSISTQWYVEGARKPGDN
jgi:hypothetical protein